MFILKKGHQPGVYVPLRALFLVRNKMGFAAFAIIMIMHLKLHVCTFLGCYESF